MGNLSCRQKCPCSNEDNDIVVAQDKEATLHTANFPVAFMEMPAKLPRQISDPPSTSADTEAPAVETQTSSEPAQSEATASEGVVDEAIPGDLAVREEPGRPRPLVPEGTQLAALLAEHSALICELRRAVGDGPEDDLVLLRFLISKEFSVAKAKDHLKKARESRAKLADVLKDARKGWDVEMPEYVRSFSAYNDCFKLWPHRSKCGAPLWLIDATMDHVGFKANVHEDDITRCLIYQMERFDMICDKINRETGRLVKIIVISDFSKWKGPPPMSTAVATLKAAGTMEPMYPQVVQAYVMTHAPRWVANVVDFIKKGLPQRAKDKISVTTGGWDKSCPVLFDNISKEALPPEMGGSADRSLLGAPLDSKVLGG